MGLKESESLVIYANFGVYEQIHILLGKESFFMIAPLFKSLPLDSQNIRDFALKLWEVSLCPLRPQFLH